MTDKIQVSANFLQYLAPHMVCVEASVPQLQNSSSSERKTKSKTETSHGPLPPEKQPYLMPQLNLWPKMQINLLLLGL